MQESVATKAMRLAKSVVENSVVQWLWSYFPFRELLAVTAEPVGDLLCAVTTCVCVYVCVYVYVCMCVCDSMCGETRMTQNTASTAWMIPK